jgi:hypothetical protein
MQIYQNFMRKTIIAEGFLQGFILFAFFFTMQILSKE